MHYGMEIPALAGWPPAKIRQHLTMRLTCGDCGHARRANKFVSSAWLQLTVDEPAEGWIEDIELVSAGGRKAAGELPFFDLQPQQHLLSDDQALLSLRIDDDAGNSGSVVATVEFTKVLDSWIGVTAGSAARSAAMRRTGPAASGV